MATPFMVLHLQWHAVVACFRPEGGAERVSENLGEFLSGDRIESSSYSIYMQHNISCSALCQVCVRVSYFEVGWRDHKMRVRYH